jgi:hypothetical protein
MCHKIPSSYSSKFEKHHHQQYGAAEQEKEANNTKFINFYKMESKESKNDISFDGGTVSYYIFKFNV